MRSLNSKEVEYEISIIKLAENAKKKEIFLRLDLIWRTKMRSILR